MNGNRGRSSQPHLIVGVTVGVSALSLLRGQLAWFRQQGWHVTLVSTLDDAARRAAERERVDLCGIAMSRRIAPASDMRALVSWVRLLGNSRPDAVNVGTPKAGLLGGLAAWVTRVPRRVYVVRGLRLEGASGVSRALLWLTERLSTAVATDVVVVSRSLANALIRSRLLNFKKTWLIGSGSSNGVDAASVAARAAAVDRADLRARLGFEPDNFVVGFIGRVVPDKGVDTLISAFQSGKMDPKCRLLIIGPIEDPALEAGIRELGPLVRSVAWTEDVWGHLPAIDVLCLPTLREGFPNVVLEAAAAGVPTITTRATGAVDSVIDGETGFVIEVGDDQALAARVNQLGGDRTLASTLGAAARQRAQTEFQCEHIWRGLREILEGHPEPVYARRLNEPSPKGENK